MNLICYIIVCVIIFILIIAYIFMLISTEKDLNRFTSQFKIEKERVEDALIEKQNLKKKEMTRELEEFKSKIEGERRVQIDAHNSAIKAMNEEYTKRRREWIEAEKEERNRVTEESLKLKKDLDKLKTEYKEKEKGIEEDFFRYSAVITGKKNLLEKEIAEAEFTLKTLNNEIEKLREEKKEEKGKKKKKEKKSV